MRTIKILNKPAYPWYNRATDSHQVKVTCNEFNMTILIGMLSSYLQQLAVAFSEEITFRGYIQSCIDKKHSFKSILITTIIFTIMHFASSPFSILLIIELIIAGIMLSFMRIISNNLWLPIGFHLANNWLEICVYGFHNNEDNTWFSTDIIKETVWNGGASGSGGVRIILFCMLLFLIIFHFKRKQRVAIQS